MVDLDHVISGAFAVSSDNCEVKVVGGIQFKFGTSKAVKQVKTAGDWFIAWGLYMQAAAFAFPPQKIRTRVLWHPNSIALRGHGT